MMNPKGTQSVGTRENNFNLCALGLCARIRKIQNFNNPIFKMKLKAVPAVILAITLVSLPIWSVAADTPIIGQIRIEITGGPGEAEQWRRIAKNLIYLEEGQDFSDDRFSQSVTALKQSGLFAAIDIPDPEWAQHAVDLKFRLKPFERIKDIRIKGGFPLLEKEIRNAMTLVPGDVCRPAEISKQASYIQSLFSAEGYIDPQAVVSVRPSPEDGHSIIDITIQKGPFYHVENVQIDGSFAFSNARLKMRLDTWQSSLLVGGPSRFVQKDLDQDIKTLRQFYLKKGYADVSLDSTVEKETDSGKVEIRITVDEGPLYEVDFSGNDAFWGFTLKKDLVLFTEGNRNGFGLRKSIRNIEKRYHEAGYLDARVTLEETPAVSEGKPKRRITIAIAEGPRYIVNSVNIEGNHAFDSEKIKKQLITGPPGIIADGQYVPETLDEDLRAVNALYLESGFRNTGIEYDVSRKPDPEDPEIIDVDVRVSIKEGPKTSISSVSIKGSVPLEPEKAIQALSMPTGSAYREYLLKPDRNALAARISEKGYPHVAVESEVHTGAGETSADITYNIDPGPYMEMGQTFLVGNFKTRDHILSREMEIDPGDPLSLSKVLNSQRNIRNINAVEAVRFQTFGLEEKAGHMDMLAEIQEIKPYYLELASGYDTYRLFYLNAAAGNSNLLGLNKDLSAAVEWSQIGYRAELGLTEPRFLGTRISSSTNLYTEKIEELNKDFGIRTDGASIGFSRALARHLTASLNFQLEYREQYRTDDQLIPEEDADAYEPRSILVTIPSLVYNSTDSFVRPTRGARATFSVDASQGLKNSLDNFFKYRLDARYYYTPMKRLTLAVHGRFGYIDPLNSQSRIPEDQLFFLGGIADVRGFSENRLRFDEDNDPVGGRTAILGSAEARLDIGMNFELAAFYDTGAVRDSLTDAGSDDFRSSAGLALRYITPIGPIGGMYGWKLDRKTSEEPGAFHFAIGYTF